MLGRMLLSDVTPALITLLSGVLIPGALIYRGHIIRKFPPEYDAKKGIPVSLSRKSKEYWDFTQKISPPIFIQNGLLGLAIVLAMDTICFLLMFTDLLGNIGFFIYVPIVLNIVIPLSFYLRSSRLIQEKVEAFDRQIQTDS